MYSIKRSPDYYSESSVTEEEVETEFTNAKVVKLDRFPRKQNNFELSSEADYRANNFPKWQRTCFKLILVLCVSVGISVVVSYLFYREGDRHYRGQIDDKMRIDDWSNWSPWGNCSASCGTGTRTRMRKCGGDFCGGNYIDKEICSNPPCIADWTEWSSWGECSVTCGAGSKSRVRQCTGSYCGEYNIDKDVCSNSPCRDSWNEWGEFGPCSVSCGTGVMVRSRTCNGTNCGDQYIDEELCSKPGCGGEWSSWGTWGSCSVSCGYGLMVRHRTCNSIHSCGDTTTSQKLCSMPDCRGTWGSWKSWGPCSTSCGRGIMSRTRTCSHGFCGYDNRQEVACSDTTGCASGRRQTSDVSVPSVNVVTIVVLLLIALPNAI